MRMKGNDTMTRTGKGMGKRDERSMGYEGVDW